MHIIYKTTFILITSILACSGVAYGEEIFGVVDWRKAIFQTDAAKAIDAKMKKENEKKLNRARELEGKLETARKKIENDRALLSPKELKEMEQTFQRELAEFNILRNNLQNIQLATESRFISSQKARMDKVLAEIAKENKLTAIIDRQAIIYGKNIKDYTQELTDKLNKTK